MADQIDIKVTASIDEASNSLTKLGQQVISLSNLMKQENVTLRNFTTQVTEGVGASAKEWGSLAQGVQGATTATEHLSFATSGAIQEYIRLGHEAMQGNFSRIPGSLVVLASRVGGLHAGLGTLVGIFGELGVAAGLVLVPMAEIIAKQIELNRVVDNSALGARWAGNIDLTTEALRNLGTEMRVVAGSSMKDITKFLEEMSRTANMGSFQLNALGMSFEDLARATGSTQAALHVLKTAFADHNLTLSELKSTFPGLSQAQVDAVFKAQALGDVHQRNAAILRLLKERLDQALAAQKAHDEEVFNAHSWWSIITGDYRAAEKDLNRLAAAQVALNQAIKEQQKADTQTDLVDPDKEAKKAEKADEDRIASLFRRWKVESEILLRSVEENGKAVTEIAKAHDREEKAVTRMIIAEWNRRKKEWDTATKYFADNLRFQEKLARESVIGLKAAITQQFETDPFNEWMRRHNEEELTQRRATLQEMDSLEQGFIRGVLSGRQRLTTVLVGFADQLLQKEISADLRALTAHLMYSEEQLAQDKAKYAEGWLTQKLFGELSVSADAKEAAAGAYASAAQIPYIGWILAPAAAAAAFMGVEAFGSFAVGSWNVPGDMIAQVHQGEMIVPKPFAQDLRSNGGMGGGAQIHLHGPFVSAWDTQTGADAFARSLPDIADQLGQYWRMNPSTRPPY